jgi:hypothetical protein
MLLSQSHTGKWELIGAQRGGGGNVHKDKYGGHSHDPNKQSIIDKAKHKVEELLHKKPKEGSPAPPAV